jgi:hypothetical protein
MRSFLILVIFLLCYGENAAQQVIGTADTSIHVTELMTVKRNAVRIDKNPINNSLYYCTGDGAIYKVVQNGSIFNDLLVCTATSHNINYLLGMLFQDSLLYLLGNWKTDTSGYGLLMRGKWQGNDTWLWDTLMRTAFYPSSATLFDHAFSSICLSPGKDSLYIGSGSRTDHGEIQTSYGHFPGRREASLTSTIFRIPLNSPSMIILPDDSVWLLNSGYVLARGVRNSFDLALAPNNDLIGTENAGDRDDPEELNWLQQDHHYGFPWQIGGNMTGQQFVNYNPANDLLINHISLAWTNNYFTNDPGYPQIPGNILVTQPIANYGPDADKFRDPLTGRVRDASDENSFITSFTPHRCPLGLVFDKGGKMAAPYSYNGFMLSYTKGTLDSSGNNAAMNAMGPFVDLGQDLLQLALFKDTVTNTYSMNCYRVAWNFDNPVDSWIEDNTIYVLESHVFEDPVTPKLYKLTFPLNPSSSGIDFLPGDTTICSGAGITLTPNLKGKFNYLWSTGNTSPVITVNPITSGTYFLKVSNGIISLTDTIHITVVSKPDFPSAIKGTVSVCRNDTRVYSIKKSPGVAYYFWTPANFTTINGSATVIATTDTFVTVSFLSGFNGDYLKVTAVNCSGQSGTRKLFVSRRTNAPGIPSVIQGQSVNLCGISNGKYKINRNAAASYLIWRCDNSSFLINGQNGVLTTTDTLVRVDFSPAWNETKLYAKAVNGCGESPERKLRITSAPAIPVVIEGAPVVCNNSTNNVYSTNVIPGSSSYLWIPATGATLVTGQGTNTILLNFGASTGAIKLTVKSQNACGNSLGYSTIINVIQCARLTNPEQNNLSIYPNPFSKSIYLDKKDQDIEKIILTNIYGQKIIEQKWSQEIDLSFLDQGIYFLEVWNNKGLLQRNRIEKIN